MNQLEQSAIQDRIRVLQEKNPFIPMHQIIYTLLREDIISCRLVPGAKLTEDQCANLYQSSRTTIRKVFDRLVEDGWLERSEGHRIKISKPSWKDHLETMEYRMAIEPTAARLAAKNRTRKELQNIEKYAKLCNTTDIYVLYVNDLEFHRSIFAASNNRYLIEAYNRLDPIMSRAKLYTAPDFESMCKECFQEHCAIYEAIRAGDESAAHKLTFQHIKMMLDANMEE